MDPEVLLGQMRCLEALGEWSELHNLSESKWDKVRSKHNPLIIIY